MAVADDVGACVLCSAFWSDAFPDVGAIDEVEPGVGLLNTAAAATIVNGSVSGINRYDTSAGQTVTYSLACQEFSGENVVHRERAMTAIFTP